MFNTKIPVLDVNNGPIYDYERQTWFVYDVELRSYREFKKGLLPEEYFKLSTQELRNRLANFYSNNIGAGHYLCLHNEMLLFSREDFDKKNKEINPNYPKLSKEFDRSNIDWALLNEYYHKNFSINPDKPPLHEEGIGRWAYYGNDGKYHGNFCNGPSLIYKLSMSKVQEIFKDSYKGEYKGRGGYLEKDIIENTNKPAGIYFYKQMKSEIKEGNETYISKTFNSLNIDEIQFSDEIEKLPQQQSNVISAYGCFE